jgi:hypothetical protein
MTKDLNEDLWNDLAAHYSDRLQTVVVDAVDTCRRGGMELEDIAVMILVPLLCESVMAANAARMDHANFMTLCSGVYKGMQEPMEKLKATRKVH